VLAGLRPERLRLYCLVPSGADTNGDLHARKAGYPNWPSNDPDVMQTALYFDPVNSLLGSRRRCSPRWVFIDTTSPPAGIWTALNQIPVAKERCP